MSTVPPAHPRPCTLHKDHPTSVAFFDESGLISKDRFFTVGLLRVTDSAALLKEVKALRKRTSYWDEFKWSGITAANRPVFEDLFTLLIQSSARFSCFVADRHVADPVSRFGNAFWAYEKLATQLLIGSVRPYEIVSVLADNYSAPDRRSFEATVKTECNARLGRLAVASVVQVDSKATEGLQLVDVLTGAVGYNFKTSVGLAGGNSHKAGVTQHVLSLLRASTLREGFASNRFKVNVYEHAEWLKRQGAAKVTPESESRGRRRRRGGRRRTRPSDGASPT